MFIPKKYGQSKIANCPFCDKRALVHNQQGIPVCLDHKDAKMWECKCLCGSWLELRTKGKWGPFFSCFKCGNMNFKRVLDLNPNPDKKKTKKETTITSNDL